MNVGNLLITRVLQHGDLVPLLDAGFNSSWLKGVGSGSEVIFSDIDRLAYKWLLEHWSKHHITPTVDMFREHFPDEVYPLSTDASTLDEAIDLAIEKVNSFLISEIIAKTIDLHDSGNISRALSYLQAESARVGVDLRIKQDRADSLNDANFDIEELLSRTVEPGVPFGIDIVDEELYGFQNGQLVTILGRQKAGKTTLTLNSALNAWEEGYDVLFFSVEMDVELLRQRLYSLGSHVSPARFRRGQLRDTERDRVREFHNKMTTDELVSFHISKKKALITVDDVLTEIRLYHPHVIYIDGFGFMMDRHTKKLAGSDWQANENVANELKTIALEEGVVIIVNVQVREKQYHAKFGIEARTIASGSGLLQASDYVIGLDKDNTQHTVSCVLSRFEYFPTTVIEIDWDSMEIEILEGKDYRNMI